MIPSNAAQKFWALIQNYFLIPGTPGSIVSVGNKNFTANGGFVYPQVSINSQTDCGYPGEKNCFSISAATTAAPNTFCYDYNGSCNNYSNFSVFLSMIQLIAGEYSCVANGNGCPTASGGLVYPTFTSAQQNFYTNFLQPIDNIVSTMPVQKGVIIPGTQVLASLNSSLAAAQVAFPYGITQLP